jgi:hypothetical protein
MVKTVLEKFQLLPNCGIPRDSGLYKEGSSLFPVPCSLIPWGVFPVENLLADHEGQAQVLPPGTWLTYA